MTNTNLMTPEDRAIFHSLHMLAQSMYARSHTNDQYDKLVCEENGWTAQAMVRHRIYHSHTYDGSSDPLAIY